MNFLFLLFSLVSISPPIAVNSEGYNCQAPISLAPPDDLSKTVYWPSTWNDSMPPFQMAPDQTCQWQITVPVGLYAKVVFYKNSPAAFVITFANGRTQGIDNNDLNPYIFTSPMFKLNLYKSSQPGLFSFKINWFKYPDASKNYIQVLKDAVPIALAPNSAFNTFVADTNVSFVGFSLKNQSHYPLLRRSALFDGDSTEAPFLGNLHQVLATGKSVISTGNYLTVYTFDLDGQLDYTLYMAQHFSNDPDPVYYKGINCYSETNCGNTINALTGPSVVVTAGNHSEFLKSVGRLADGVTLKIYEGVVSDKTLVTTLTNANYQYRLPMELKNTIRQYLLSYNSLDITLSYDAADAKWNKVYDGRKGFVHSYYHGLSSDQQDTNETFVSTSSLYFNYIVRDADFTGNDTSLTVTVFSNGEQVSVSTYTSKNLPSTTTTSVQGDTYNVKYATNGVFTNGLRIDFSMASTAYTPGTSTTGTSATTTPKPSTPTTPTVPSTTVPSTSLTSSVASSPSTRSSSATSIKLSSVPPRESSSFPTTSARFETTTKGSLTQSPILIIIPGLIFISLL